MNDEIFDIVNERDEVIGRLPRFQVHRDAHKHRAVHVLVFNARGEIFLQKRSRKKDTFPGAWDSSASGHVDSGEDYDACAVRELREELGLGIEAPPRRLFKIGACSETGHEFVWVYRLESEGPFTLHPEEIDCGGWFAPAHVDDWVKICPGDFASGFVLIWRNLTRAR
ncbi:MAG TPA: NUDIX domain-containing protein [Candidatus Saccharimonadales bacterium]|nr:NUDIX domain-containing protein [Candidatus Saccharimonadales bacterium]